MKRKICILKSRMFPLTNNDISNGGDLNVFHIIQKLIELGCELHVFTRKEENFPLHFSQGLLNINYIPYQPSKSLNVFQRDYEEGLSFCHNLSKSYIFTPNNYDLIHSHHWSAGIKIAQKINKNVHWVHTPHLLAFEKAESNKIFCPEIVIKAEQEILDRANIIISLSKAETASLKYKYKVIPDKIFEVPTGIDRNFFDVSFTSLDTNKPLSLLTIGRICQQKGFDILISAFDNLIEEEVNLILKIIGISYGENDYERNFMNTIKSTRLKGRIEVKGKISHRLIHHEIAQCPIYIQSSRYESQGISILEAMAASRIVIASDLPAVKEYLIDGYNGFLFEAENHRSLADVIKKVLSSETLVKNLALNAKDTATKFSLENFYRKILPIILDPKYLI